DVRKERVARSLLDAGSAVADALGVLQVMWTSSWSVGTSAPTAPLSTTYPVVQHIFEWLSGVLGRADDRLTDELEGRVHEVADLGAVEYSSLFVRSI
ncbi:hypothetical protein, partial [Clostridioides difficile]|uniref:hypothetical protein n=1 Tax=Clostridioides difficile TaxID=1496 RepID=UPI0018DCD42A